MWPKKKNHEVEDEVEFRRKVNDGLLERIWAKLEEARAVPEEPGALEDLENDDEPEEDP